MSTRTNRTNTFKLGKCTSSLANPKSFYPLVCPRRREGFESLPQNWITKPFYFFVSFARVFAMRTSKIPRWPEWVEQECWITKKDPYVRDSGYVEA
ncbi:hypothetical protein ABT364_19050 [Massilia sp. SR12]